VATVTFDTHKFVKTLKEAGVPESQAEAFSTAVRESMELRSWRLGEICEN